MSLVDLLTQSEDERRQYALSIRTRMKSCTPSLAYAYHFYMLWTKADLIAGFNEYFATLSKEERRKSGALLFHTTMKIIR